MRAQFEVGDLPDDVLVYLLGSRYCDTQKLSDLAWSLFARHHAGLAARAGDLRLRASADRSATTTPAATAPRRKAMPNRSASAAISRILPLRCAAA